MWLGEPFSKRWFYIMTDGFERYDIVCSKCGKIFIFSYFKNGDLTKLPTLCVSCRNKYIKTIEINVPEQYKLKSNFQLTLDELDDNMFIIDRKRIQIQFTNTESIYEPIKENIISLIKHTNQIIENFDFNY